MSSIPKLVAEALAYRWGELREKPPTFIDDLMVELTMALAAARESGNEERAVCLDEVLDALAEGIYKYEHQAGQDVGEKTLGRAIAEIRTYYYLKSSIPGLPGLEARELGTLAKEQGPVDILLDREEIAMILN